MIGDITQNLVGQFNNNFGKNNQMDYPKGGINYLDNGNNAEPLVGKVTYGEKISKSYTPAKLLSVSNKQGDYSTGGKMFAAASSVITTYLNKANKKNLTLLLCICKLPLHNCFALILNLKGILFFLYISDARFFTDFILGEDLCINNY